MSPLQRAVSECLPGFIAVVAFSLCINILLLTVPIYLMQLFDRVLPSRSSDTLVLLFVISTAALLVLGALDAVRSFLLARIGARFDAQLSRPVFSQGISVQSKSIAHAKLQGLGDLVTLRAFVSSPAITALMDAPWTPIFMLVIFVLHPELGWLSVVGGACLLVVAFISEFASRGALRRAGESILNGMAEADASIRNADVVEAMGMKPTMVERWHRRSSAAIDLELRATHRVALLRGFSKFLRFALQIGVMTAGAWLVIRGELTAGGMTAATLLLARALAPIEQVIAASKSLASAHDAYRRVKAQLASPKARKTQYALPAPSGRIAVEDLVFAYPESRQPIIRGIGFGIAPGEAMGIIGPTAAGKTTLARLLVGNLTPLAGHVRLDGMDISVWDHDDVGRHIGYLPQDVQLFSGTIRENIARMSEGSSDAVVEAAQLAGVHDMIMSMRHGYETDIGRAGMALSGGQRQRIGLARALYGEPKLVVLDEPNANLDRDGELALVRVMMLCKRRNTSLIVIAHRPQLLAHVDSILVLRGGGMAFHGSRDEVIARLREPAAERPREDERLLTGIDQRRIADPSGSEGKDG